MNNSTTIRILRNLSLVTGRSVLYELARRTASKIYGISSIENYINYRFYDKRLSLWNQYIINNELRVLQYLAIPQEFRRLTTNKASFAKRCSELNIPTPATKCLYLREGCDTQPADAVFRDEKKFDSYIRSFCDGFYLVKPVTGRYGDGIVKFEVRNGKLINTNGRDTTASQLIEDASSNRYGDAGLIVQEFIQPHSDLRPIMNGPGLGTIRLVTLRSPDGETKVAWAVLKLPLRDSITDNFSVGETGNLIAAIDVKSGKILRAVGLNQEIGLMDEVVEHPETHAKLSGYQLPAWEVALEHVRSAASAFTAFPSLGWDVALGEQGPIFIEMNTYWGCGPIQIAYDTGIREEILHHYAVHGIDLSRYDETLDYLRTDEGRVAQRGQ